MKSLKDRWLAGLPQHARLLPLGQLRDTCVNPRLDGWVDQLVGTAGVLELAEAVLH